MTNFEDIYSIMETSTIDKKSKEYKKEYQRLYREKMKNDPEYVQLAKERMKQYKLNNPDKYKKYNMKWRNNNKDKIKEYQQTHKNEINEYNKAYFKKMRDVYKASRLASCTDAKQV